jgi:PAS domain S-box-containing protein
VRTIRVLLVEDDENDAVLLAREIERGGYAVCRRRVETEAEMREALLGERWDVVIADNSLPSFSSLAALRVLQSTDQDLPFLIVSGSIPENLGVDVMRAGAHDFLTKDRLARLVPAVEREMREAQERRGRRDAERRMQRSEDRYRRFFEDDLTGDVLTDADGAIVDCNASFLRIFGFSSKAHALSATMSELYASAPAEAAVLDRVRREGSLEGWEGEMCRRDGTPVYVVANIVRERDAAGEPGGLRAYYFDATERRRLEEQLRHAQRMEAVGRLAGGVAHDFNNLLSAIGGYTELLLGREADPTSSKYLVEVKKATERATLLTRRLLAFSRKQVVQTEVLDPNVVVADLEGMLHRLIREDISLRLELDRATPRIEADKGHFEQVLVNLVVNSRDALPNGGAIEIRTEPCDVGPEGDPGDGDVPAGRYARITVTDDGVGMSSEVRSHVFEPFFTTKAEGKGTGLGLATVYGIVQQAHGHVRLTTKPGEGTSFRVYWPAAGAPPPAPRVAGRAADLRRGTETVLLVEDNPMVRGVLVELLAMRGYRILEAADGAEALARSAAHEGPIHALVSDVVMPEMHGPELAELLRRARPGLRILFLSAYAEDEEEIQKIGALGAASLPKPFRMEELLSKLHAILA